MRLPKSIALFVGVLFVVSSCGDKPPVTPTSPSGGTAPVSTPPTVMAVSVNGGGPQATRTAQMTAIANLSNGTSQNVTSSASWQSSNVAVATVGSGGLVTGVGVGLVDISAIYQNIRGTITLTVSPAPTYTLSGVVTDGTSGGILPNIRVGIGSGPNAGKSTRTDGQGRFSLGGVIGGAMTLSASNAGYQTVDKPLTVTGDLRVDFVLPRSTGGGGNGGGGGGGGGGGFGSGALIQFRTNATTCSCWDQTIGLRLNGQNAGSMRCSGSSDVAVAPGSYSAQLCDSTGCLSQAVTVSSTMTGVVTASCSAALNTSESAIRRLTGETVRP